MNNDAVDKYLSKVDEKDRAELERIRAIVKKTLPEVTEGISYGMPGFKYMGQYLLGYASFKDHLSLFPTSGPIEELRSELKNYKTAKGTIQFAKENPVPESLIIKIIKTRQESINQKSKKGNE